MIAEVDDDGSNEIEFSEFLKVHGENLHGYGREQKRDSTNRMAECPNQYAIAKSVTLQNHNPNSASCCLQVIENQKKRDSRADDDSDTVLAYVALGGNSDKTGASQCGHT